MTRRRSMGHALPTRDNRATILTPVPGDFTFHRFHFLEFVPLATGSIETFGAIAVAEFVFGDGQMTVPAAQCFLAFRQKLQSRVITGSHGELCS